MSTRKKNLKDLIVNHNAVIGVLLLVIFGTCAFGGSFISYSQNLVNVLYNASLMSIMGLGFSLCVLTGGLDLSVAAVGSLSAMMAALVCNAQAGFIPSLLAGLTVGLVVGLLNGFIIGYLKVQPFIATLGTQFGAHALALLVNEEKSISISAEEGQGLVYLGNGKLFDLIPVPLALFIFLLIIIMVMTKLTPFGRKIYAVGGNAEAAEMMGINVALVKLVVYALSGIFAGLAGVILCGHLHSGQPTSFIGWEMTILAAIIIGGTNVAGGRGNVYGIFFGALFIQFITNLINLDGHINPYWGDIITGLLLLGVILLQEGSRGGISGLIKKLAAPKVGKNTASS